MKESLLVPFDRINVIKDKKTREFLEKNLNIKLSFLENNIEIEGEGLDMFQAKNIIKAIARGFSPEKAFRLLKEDEQMEIIELRDMSEKKMKITKARLIGTKGKTRRQVEFYSGCSVSIYGKTVSLIGNYEQLNVAREAINMIIRGTEHSKVYKFLEEAKITL